MQIVTGLFLMFYDLLVQIAAKLRGQIGPYLRQWLWFNCTLPSPILE